MFYLLFHHPNGCNGQGQVLLPCVSCGYRDHLLLVSQVCWQRVRSEVEHLVLELCPYGMPVQQTVF